MGFTGIEFTVEGYCLKSFGVKDDCCGLDCRFSGFGCEYTYLGDENRSQDGEAGVYTDDEAVVT
jgi:hypothetical protein